MTNKDIVSILERHKLGQIKTDKAMREVLVLFGVKKSSTCKEDNLPGNCPIIRNTSFKDCKNCGHFV